MKDVNLFNSSKVIENIMAARNLSNSEAYAYAFGWIWVMLSEAERKRFVQKTQSWVEEEN
jgi:uncharacterized NAD(P)/FAD-binding protein YdhS